jgi:hypothetical protein
MTTEDERYSEEETARRRDDAIRRALNTPPKPQRELVGKRPSPRRQPIKTVPDDR